MHHALLWIAPVVIGLTVVHAADLSLTTTPYGVGGEKRGHSTFYH